MPFPLTNYNTSILAISAYYVLTTLPHLYAVHIATQGHYTKYHNANPRSPSNKNSIKSKLDPATYSLYERAEACHQNGFENLPLFTTAVILGTMADFPKNGFWGMTGFAAGYLVSRCLYTLAYLGFSSDKGSVVRSGIWAVGTGMCLRVIVKAAGVLGGRKAVF